jgi:hypothetical protein
MDTLVGATQRISICDLTEFSDFYCKFCTIVEYLSSPNRIGDREISTNFIRALPADLQHKIMFHIQVSNPNRHVDDPHTLKSLFDAGVHILKGNTTLDTMNPYAVAAAYAQPPNPAVQQPQVAQQSPVNYPQNAYIPGTSISLPYGYYQPPAPFPYHQQTVLVQPPAPATTQPNTYQPLPYTPGLKQEDIMTIATTVASAFTKQLTPLFQQQPRGNTSQNNAQNRGAFTCAFCGQASHGICDCSTAQTYVTEKYSPLLQKSEKASKTLPPRAKYRLRQTQRKRTSHKHAIGKSSTTMLSRSTSQFTCHQRIALAARYYTEDRRPPQGQMHP